MINVYTRNKNIPYTPDLCGMLDAIDQEKINVSKVINFLHRNAGLFDFTKSFRSFPDNKSWSGHTLLGFTIKKKLTALVNAIVEYDGKNLINAKDSFGSSPFYKAFKLRQLNTLKLLLNNGANINEKYQSQSKEMKSLFQKALDKRDRRIFRFFILNGVEEVRKITFLRSKKKGVSKLSGMPFELLEMISKLYFSLLCKKSVLVSEDICK